MNDEYYVGYQNCPWCGGKLVKKDGINGEYFLCT